MEEESVWAYAAPLSYYCSKVQADRAGEMNEKF